MLSHINFFEKSTFVALSSQYKYIKSYKSFIVEHMKWHDNDYLRQDFSDNSELSASATNVFSDFQTSLF